jgi:hypothetical protein
MQDVILYTKANCGLCDQAYQILLNLAYDTPLRINLIDITQNHRTHAKYMERIPVLATSHPDIELNWPFTVEDVQAFLDKSEVLPDFDE